MNRLGHWIWRTNRNDLRFRDSAWPMGLLILSRIGQLVVILVGRLRFMGGIGS